MEIDNYYIYKTTNNINGKVYIGQRVTSNNIENDDYLGSGKLLLKAIAKYGKQNFSKQILYIVNSRSELNQIQKELVNQEFVLKESNYNLALGGYGGRLGKEVAQKISKSHLGKKLTQQHKQKIRIAELGKKCKPISEQLRRFRSQRFKGERNPNYGKPRTFETKQKIGIAHRGKTVSSELKSIISEKTKLGMKNMDPNKFCQFQQKSAASRRGKHLSQEAKKKMSKTITGRKYIHNGIIQKKVDFELLDGYLQDSWILGRLPRNKKDNNIRSV